ncbi:nucleolar MIF4G domain-containing protein 1 homolog [Vespa crabro]|uniref:nucleolar MIF4G domain-containing protein 1 homolog n=1 Tax=Vespa crabro TaxID=7445 RepID=UPI001EFFB83C|nr:nucleolar MIF4G domain-containing protein 1 homolog [Vespa crabro]
MVSVKRKNSIFKNTNSKKNKPCEKTRKQIRKEKRQEKKAKKAMFYQNRKQVLGRFVLNPDRMKENVTKSQESYNELQNNSKHNVNEKFKNQKKKRKRDIKSNLTIDNENEDKMIKQLEKRLKLNKRKSNTIPKSFVNDGLDYLLDFCDNENRKQVVEMEEQLLKGEGDKDLEEDIAMFLENDDTKYTKNHDTNDWSNDEQHETQIMLNKNKFKKKKQNEMIDSIKESDEEDETNLLSDKSINDIETDISQESSDSDNLWEDIYGRTRDKKGNIVNNISSVIQRKPLEAMQDNDEKRCRLKKQLKGLLNKLAESNMHIIANQVDELYMCNSRNDMNTILSELIIQALISPVLTPDRLICEHMMLITILHANVGTEVGAHFLLTFSKKFDEMLKAQHTVEDKQLDNLVLLLSHLYNFKVYNHQLLYQILDKLSSKFEEKEIELILLILKTAGFPLRKDDPLALKELILNLQKVASNIKSDNSRVKFMLDVLMAIKNNNVSKIPQYDPSHTEHLKKLMKSFIHKGKNIVKLNISLEDLLKADERGKWWIIGCAWSGNRNLDKGKKIMEENKAMFSQNILDLARKQRMNTDIRRNIFCILMTAEDYLDAFEKLSHLGLTDQQEREIIYVLMDCCLQEKKFNPYYAVLAERFCVCDRKYQLTIQYMLWDKFKILDNYDVRQLANLAKFLTHLFIQRSLSISILKILNFAELNKQTMKLVRQIMIGIFLCKNEEDCLQVFERISLSPLLQTFRESLRLFINHFLIRNIESCKVMELEGALIKQRAYQVEKLLLNRECKILF